MPGENLTRSEAEERAALVTVHDYDRVLDVTVGPELFTTTTTVRFDATAGASTFIDAITAAVHSVTVMASMNVDAPAVAVNRTVVWLRNTSGPVVTSSTTS